MVQHVLTCMRGMLKARPMYESHARHNCNILSKLASQGKDTENVSINSASINSILYRFCYLVLTLLNR